MDRGRDRARQREREEKAMEWRSSSILLLAPNVIDYFRIVLILLAFPGYYQPEWFVPLYTTSVILDWVDGYAARKLNQRSDFGAWLDVVVDLISRGLLWCWLTPHGYAVTCVEWLTFVSTHSLGADWKSADGDLPRLVSMVMADEFQSLWGTFAVTGLHFLPLWLYACQSGFLSLFRLPVWAQLSGVGLLALGRVLCLYAEMFYICNHVKKLLQGRVGRKER